VAVAHPGEEIDVAPGSYRGEVFLTKRLSIKGFHSPIVDARGYDRGIEIRGEQAAGSVVRGLVVENADFEGVLALSTKRVTIADNVVRENDRAAASHPLTGECTAHSRHPGVGLGDLRAGGCGEALHLASTSDSSVAGNLVTDNTGGIYLTDESGPAAHNLITHNRVLGNLYDCGITLASHSTRTVAADGRLNPHAGGVYDNTVTGNVSDRNGLRGTGSGILVAAAFKGGAAYGNRIIGNTVTGNGEPGITLHSHDPRQDLNNNIVRDNVVGLNAVGGTKGGPGDDAAGIHHTAGILVWSAFTRVTGVQVSGNRISDNYFGIWTQNMSRLPRAANQYSRVRVPLSQR
jgi:parallel beta-helix repeat protein